MKLLIICIWWSSCKHELRYFMHRWLFTAVTSHELHVIPNCLQLDCLLNCLFNLTKKKRTACALFILCKGIHQFPVDSLHKGPVVQKLFQCHLVSMHDDVIKWKHFPRYWPFVRGIHRSPVNSPHKGQWCGDLMFRLFCAWINGWANNREAGDLRRHRAHYGIIVMALQCHTIQQRIIVLITWPT